MVDFVNLVQVANGVVHKRKFHGWSSNEIMQLSRSLETGVGHDV